MSPCDIWRLSFRHIHMNITFFSAIGGGEKVQIVNNNNNNISQIIQLSVYLFFRAGEGHALPYLDWPEGTGQCARDGPSRGQYPCLQWPLFKKRPEITLHATIEACIDYKGTIEYSHFRYLRGSYHIWEPGYPTLQAAIFPESLGYSLIDCSQELANLKQWGITDSDRDANRFRFCRICYVFSLKIRHYVFSL